MSYAAITEDIKKTLSALGDTPADLSSYVRKIRTWEEMYYLHPSRTNVLRFYEFEHPGSILEIGGDGGVYTAYLATIFDRVCCIDAEEASAALARCRCENEAHVEIRTGALSSVLPDDDPGYDYVFLHKAFLSPEGYVTGEDPHSALLTQARAILKPGGRLLLLTENRLGLRYWAGVKNAQNGRYFSGLTGYEPEEKKKSFSKGELTELLQNAGFSDLSFYYPYPDECFTKCVYSDDYLPKPGELTENIRNFDDERVVLFDEGQVFDTILKEGRFADFSNAFLIQAACEE